MVHGDADDNVPVTEARRMLKELTGISPEVKLHEEPGAGHWWDRDPAPGADSVAYAPMMDWMRKKERRTKSARGQVSCISPSYLPASNSLRILQQIEPYKVSQITWEIRGSHLTCITKNVARFEWSTEDSVTSVDVDGKSLSKAQSYALRSTGWCMATSNKESLSRVKNPARCGPFKEIFDHRVVFVYGSNCSGEEKRMLRAKAQYDAEQLWYRGNGAASVISDTEWMKYKYWSNVLLYGNADSNHAWSWLLGSSPIQVRNGLVQVGDREIKRNDLSVFFIRPRWDTPDMCVGAIAPTGMVGARLSVRQPLFSAGAGYPDWLILAPEMLQDGLKGIPGAGFFGNDWEVSWKNSAWRLGQ